uniref:RRM domain-containing protein n=1 Tax=Salix viminalis TaxID=40686 RepID=A0A6N2N1M8_SALVM
MAASAAAAGSSFSPSSIHTFKRMHIKHCLFDHLSSKIRGSAEEAEGETDEVPVNTKLFFGNLPYNVDSAQLAGIIQEYVRSTVLEKTMVQEVREEPHVIIVGTVSLLSATFTWIQSVLYHRETRRSRGFAFVTMSSIEDCNAAIENLDGSGELFKISNPKNHYIQKQNTNFLLEICHGKQLINGLGTRGTSIARKLSSREKIIRLWTKKVQIFKGMLNIDASKN